MDVGLGDKPARAKINEIGAHLWFHFLFSEQQAVHLNGPFWFPVLKLTQ